MLIIIVLAYGIVLCSSENVESHCDGTPLNMTTEQILQKCLFNNYESESRPVTDAGQTVHVNISFYLITVAQVYDKENAVLLENYIRESWFDHRLKWNPNDFDGIKRIHVNQYRIWEPELTTWDNRENTPFLESKRATVSYTGEVEWINQMRLNAYCPMNYARFPFDKQDCVFYLQHRMYDISLVNINVIYPTESKMPRGTCYSLQDEWNVNECYVQIQTVSWEKMNSSYIALHVQLDRQYSYHCHLVVIPSIIVVLVTLSLFWLPHESNQRFMSAGGMLCVIFLENFIIQQFLPPGLNGVPVIASYHLYAAFVVIVVVMISMITRNLHHKDPREEVVPDIIRKIFLNTIVGKATCVMVSLSNVSLENKTWNEPIQRGGESFSPGGGEHRTNAFGQNAEKLLEDIRRHLGVLENTANITNSNEWKQLALIIDRLSFYIFFILNIIISTALYAH